MCIRDSHVGGLTAEEAAVSIESLLRDEKILKHPHVEVFVQEYATQGVSILGEVKNPGVYPELGSHSLLDFISVAGGITPTAGKAVTVTHKNDPETITVRLKEYATVVYTNRFTPLSATVNTLAPTQVVEFSSPATNGTVLIYSTNTTYLVSACFSSSLASATGNFNILINGVLQPQSNYILRPSGPCSGMKAIFFNWNNPSPGTNSIQIIYTNAITPIGDSRLVTVSPPLVISGLGSNNQLILWNSASGVNYQVLATTNLSQPFQVISGIIPGQGITTSFYDPNPASQKFYEIQMVQ